MILDVSGSEKAMNEVKNGYGLFYKGFDLSNIYPWDFEGGLTDEVQISRTGHDAGNICGDGFPVYVAGVWVGYHSSIKKQLVYGVGPYIWIDKSYSGKPAELICEKLRKAYDHALNINQEFIRMAEEREKQERMKVLSALGLEVEK